MDYIHSTHLVPAIPSPPIRKRSIILSKVFVLQVLLSTIVILSLAYLTLYTTTLVTNSRSVYTYTTPTRSKPPFNTINIPSHTRSTNNHNNQNDTQADTKSAGIITALHTRAMTNITNAIIPDLFTKLTTSKTTITDGDTHYTISVFNAAMDKFEIDADGIFDVRLSGLNFTMGIAVRYRGTIVKVAADVDVSLTNLEVHTQLQLENIKGVLGFTVKTATVTANDIKVHIKHRLGFLINPFIGNVHDMAVKSIHDALYNSLNDLGNKLAQGVPMMCDLQAFNGAIDMSILGDVQYKPIKPSSMSLLPKSYDQGEDFSSDDDDDDGGNNGYDGDGYNDTTSITPHFEASISDNALVIGFNGETVDIRTRRPLSNVPRGSMTIPLDDSDPTRLLSVGIDQFVFNSYYDAWYNRGMQAQQERVDEFWADQGHQQNNSQHHPSFNNGHPNPFNTVGLVLHTYAVPINTVLMAHMNTTIRNDANQHEKTTNDSQNYQQPNQNNPNQSHIDIITAIASTHPDLYQILVDTAQPQHATTGHMNNNSNKDAKNNNNQLKADDNVILIEVSIVARPVLDLNNDSTAITTISEQRFVVYNPTGLIPYQLLFTITTTSTTTLSMHVQYDQIVDTFVLVPLLRNLQSKFECTYSLVGPIPLDLLNIVLETITTTILLPLMNQQLFRGIDLPSPPNFFLTNPQITVPTPGLLLVRAGLTYQAGRNNRGT